MERRDFNSYGSRRGNHEVMMRGTFANIRIRNEMVPGVEGGMTRHLPGTEVVSIYDAAVKYQQEGTPLAVIAGKEYGSGSSRDWAAKRSAPAWGSRGHCRIFRTYSPFESYRDGDPAARVPAGRHP